MISLLVAASTGLIISIFGTPAAIRYFRRRSIGQFIQEEVEGHHHKQGTPTMGGVVFVVAVVIAYFLAHVKLWTPATGLTFQLNRFYPGGMLAMLAFVGMALIGFLDDYTKHTRKRSLGLSIKAKYAGQLLIAILFAWGASVADVSTQLSFVRPLGIDLGPLFVVLVLLMITGFANGANFADGMDGLAAGSAALMFGAYTIIAFWQNNQNADPTSTLYQTATDPFEVAILATAMLGALLGFLWWNAPPARIFMGDVGSNAIGGLLAAMAILTNTQLLLVIVAALYVAESFSSALQILWYKAFKKRVFRMAPIHHHFEMLGWPETTVVIRFWILAGIGVALGLGFFYGDFLAQAGVFQ
jgi:phospho-N-acetylmuramoyl-pentapeptide-transferase